jgi:hypothetical protein
VGLCTSLTSLPSLLVNHEAQHRVVVHHCCGLIIESSDRTSSSSPPRTSSCKGGGWSLCAMWRSSSSSLIGRRHRMSLLRPPCYRPSTSRDGVSGPRFCTPRILLSTLSPPSSPPAIGNTTLVSVHRRTLWSATTCQSAARLGHARPCEPNRPAGPFHELGRTLGHGPRSGVAS